MVETIIDMGMKAVKNVLLIIGRILYKIVAAIPDFFLIFLFLLFLILAYFIGKWAWKNRKEWRAREF